MPTKTKHERFLYAEEQAARHLGNYNEEVERGAARMADGSFAVAWGIEVPGLPHLTATSASLPEIARSGLFNPARKIL